MAKVRSTETLRRYTDLPALLHLLKNRSITLLDPSSWDDTNDSYYLLKYKEKLELKTVLALCLTEAAETYHHWRIFSHGTAGVCIDFHRENLIAALENESGVVVKPVKYRKVRIDGKQAPAPRIEELPFIKRQGFIAEQEVRAVFESKTRTVKFLDIKFELSIIRRITLSPWLHKSLTQATKEAIQSNKDCRDLAVRRSTLVGNDEWKRLGDNAT